MKKKQDIRAVGYVESNGDKEKIWDRERIRK